MGAMWQLWGLCGGIVFCSLASAAWWNHRSKLRIAREIEHLEKSLPTARDGLLISALAVELVTEEVIERDSWMSELISQMDVIVARQNLKRVGAFQTTYMVVATDERVAKFALQHLAQAALDLRDQILLYSSIHSIGVRAKFGIHADIIASSGLGSTVALSQLWSETLEMAELAKVDSIQLSSQCAEWLGPLFDVEELSGRPVLYGRKLAA